MAHPVFIFIVMFVLMYYKEFTFVLRLKVCLLLLLLLYIKKSYLSHDPSTLYALVLNIFSSFKLNLDCTEGLFYNNKINNHVFKFPRKKQVRNVFNRYNKRRFITVNSYVDISKSNILNTSNSGGVIVNSNFPRINVQTRKTFNTIIIFKHKLIQSQVLLLILKHFMKNILVKEYHLIKIQQK